MEGVKANDLKTVAFTGGTGGEMAKLAAGHQICGMVEAALSADGE